MADRTTIEWTDASWNPFRGCRRVSTGCEHCYAERIAARFSDEGLAFFGLAVRGQGGGRWTGETQVALDHLEDPLRWRRPRRVFVNSMSDTFYDGFPDSWIDTLFAVMAVCPRHTFQVLTKRASRMRRYMTNPSTPARVHAKIAALGAPAFATDDWPLPNVWLGVSVEDQETADSRVPELLWTPAAVRFLSCEPLLGPLDLSFYLCWPTADRCVGHCEHCDWIGPSDQIYECWDDTGDCQLLCPACHHAVDQPDLDGLSWVIAGGESGPGARPMDIAWVETIARQCAASNTAFFMKQLSQASSHEYKVYDQFPPSIRVRQYPTTDTTNTEKSA